MAHIIWCINHHNSSNQLRRIWYPEIPMLNSQHENWRGEVHTSVLARTPNHNNSRCKSVNMMKSTNDNYKSVHAFRFTWSIYPSDLNFILAQWTRRNSVLGMDIATLAFRGTNAAVNWINNAGIATNNSRSPRTMSFNQIWNSLYATNSHPQTRIAKDKTVNFN